MKRFIKFVSVLALGLALASCSKEAPGKSEVEAGFDAASNALPQLTLGANPAINAAAGYAEVDLTIAGVSTAEGLEVGVLSSSDASFTTSNFVAVESPANGTVKVKAKVAPNSTYYVMASATYADGTSVFSDPITIQVPDVPFWAKVEGQYAATISSVAYGDSYNHVITVMLNPDDPQNKCYIGDIEPYWYGQGATFAGGYNYVEATIDNENNALIVALGANIHVTTADGPRFFYGINDAGTAYAPYTFKLASDGSSLVGGVSGWQVILGDGAEDQYTGGVYKKL